MLTCARECKGDSSLAWRGGGADGWQNASVGVNGTLRNRLVLPVSSAAAADRTCLVLSDGVVMASRKWSAINCEYAFSVALRGRAGTTISGSFGYKFEVFFNRISTVWVKQGQNMRNKTRGPTGE